MSVRLPKLRYLEAFPVSQEGRRMVALRDPWQISEATLLVTPELYSLLPLFNGENSILDIQTILTRRSGQLVFREQIESIIEQLDQALFLENEHYQNKKQEIASDYSSSSCRPSSHVGASYPEDPAELGAMIDSFYTHPEGAGRPGSAQKRRIRAAAAPHIDLRLGGPIYSHVYRALAESELSETFIILGIGHTGLPDLFSISGKHFETPLGRAETDTRFLDRLFASLGEPIFTDDLSHRTEHSIEFQVILLQHLFQKRSFRIVAILTSFSYRELTGPKAADTAAKVDRFVHALLEAESNSRRRVTLLASVDLAHIGPRYGDPFNPGRSTVSEALEKDRELLDCLIRSDRWEFLDYVVAEQDRRRICGFPALYTLLGFLQNEKGILLAHGYSEMDPTHSFVTYAGLVWHTAADR